MLGDLGPREEVVMGFLLGDHLWAAGVLQLVVLLTKGGEASFVVEVVAGLRLWMEYGLLEGRRSLFWKLSDVVRTLGLPHQVV